MMSEWFLEAANHTCGNYDRGVNEIELTGLTPMPSVRVGHFAQAENPSKPLQLFKLPPFLVGF